MHHAAAAAAKKIQIARTRFEGTSGYDNTEIAQVFYSRTVLVDSQVRPVIG
jgi:hypothetical protein